VKLEGRMMIKSKNDTIEIRLATMDELGQILSILDKAAIWLFDIGIKNQWIPGEVYKPDIYYENAIKNKQWYVALENEVIVGTFLIRWTDKNIWQDRDKSAGYIHHLAIDRTCSIPSLGEKLLQWVEERIKMGGKDKIRLDCMATNKRLNEYYLTKGYQFVKQYEYYDGEMGNLYEKPLI